jgi:Uma2 family endonuclease
MSNDNEGLFVREAAEPLRSEAKRYAYADYALWETDDRYELIDGYPYMMSAPSISHQRVLVELTFQFVSLLKGKPCEVFVAPLDVCLFGLGDDDETVVQPDLIVICDKSKLDAKRCNGAPDMVIEILSPSSQAHDTRRKLDKYHQAGVKEYWIVDPDKKRLMIHMLVGGKYKVKEFDATAIVTAHVLGGSKIYLAEVFAEH